MKIVWHTIPDFPEYEINRLGEIRRKSTGRVLKPFDDRRGYLRVSLNGCNVKVHLLVAKMFVPNPHGYPVVDHKRGNKHDTRSPIRLAISANMAANFTVACKIIPRRRTGLPMPPPAYGKLLPTLPKSGRLGLSRKARMTPTPRVQRSLTLISTGPLTWTTTSGSLAFMAGRR